MIKSPIVFTAAKKPKEVIKNPSPTNPPIGINPKAKEKHWKEFCTKYSKVWKKASTPEDTWACCVAIWTNYCLKRKIMPFTPEESQATPEIIEVTKERVEGGREAQLKNITMIERTGKDKGIISTIFKETFASFEVVRSGIFEVKTKRKIRLTKETTTRSPAFKQWMSFHAYNNMKGIFKRDLKGGASIWIEGIPNKPEAEIYLVNTFTNAKLQYLLNLDSEEIKDITKVKKTLVKYWKTLMKKKFKTKK